MLLYDMEPLGVVNALTLFHRSYCLLVLLTVNFFQYKTDDPYQRAGNGKSTRDRNFRKPEMKKAYDIGNLSKTPNAMLHSAEKKEKVREFTRMNANKMIRGYSRPFADHFFFFCGV
jgi:hypothetical protein